MLYQLPICSIDVNTAQSLAGELNAGGLGSVAKRWRSTVTSRKRVCNIFAVIKNVRKIKAWRDSVQHSNIRTFEIMMLLNLAILDDELPILRLYDCSHTKEIWQYLLKEINFKICMHSVVWFFFVSSENIRKFGIPLERGDFCVSHAVWLNWHSYRQ